MTRGNGAWIAVVVLGLVAGGPLLAAPVPEAGHDAHLDLLPVDANWIVSVRPADAITPVKQFKKAAPLLDDWAEGLGVAPEHVARITLFASGEKDAGPVCLLTAS